MDMRPRSVEDATSESDSRFKLTVKLPLALADIGGSPDEAGAWATVNTGRTPVHRAKIR